MSKPIIITLVLSMLVSGSPVTAFAEDKISPADLPETVYQQLLEHSDTDANKDGILTEEEYCNATYISLDLDGITSIDFLSRLKHPRYLYLRNGNISDFSSLAQFKTLETLQLSDMPQVTDISFAKDMGLMKFYIVSLEQITDEQKLAVMTFHDADTAVGYSAMAGATPTGMFTYDELTFEIADKSIAGFDTQMDTPARICAASVYGKTEGSTEYIVKLHGEEIHRGSIHVNSTTPTVLSATQKQAMPKMISSSVYAPESKVILQNGTLYKLKNGTLETIAEHSADFDSDYGYDETGKFFSIETVLLQDGTIEINGEKPGNADGLHFKTIGRDCCVTDSGDVYCIRRENGQYLLDRVYSGFSGFLENSDMYFVSDTGEVILLELKYSGKTVVSYQALPTGIKNVTSSYGHYFIDENKVLWEVDRKVGGKPSVLKRATDVVFVGYRWYDNGRAWGCVHITSDGTAYHAGRMSKVVLSDKSSESPDYLDAGKFVLDAPDGAAAGGPTPAVTEYNYHLTNGHILCMEYDGHKAAVSDVESYIAASRNDASDDVYAYFLKSDGTVWSYSFAKQDYSKLTDAAAPPEPETLMGDVNADGVFDVTDIVLFQKWLLAVPDTRLANPKAGDLCEDDVLDVFDLARMKHELLTKNS